MPKRALVLLLCFYSVTCWPSSFSTSLPTTSRPSNPAWDLEVESAETNEQTDTQTNTVVQSGDEPQSADGQDNSVVVQQNETPEQTEAVQQEAVAVSQQIQPVQQQSEQVSNVVQNVASVVEEQTLNTQPDPVAVAEGQTQGNDQSLVEQPAAQDTPQVTQDKPQVAQETQQTVQETPQTAQETQQIVEQNDESLQANQPQVVVDPLKGSTMATSDNQYGVVDTAQQAYEVQQQNSQVDQTQPSSENQVIVVQQAAEKEVQEGESGVGGSTPFPSSSSGILAVQESQGSSGPTEETSVVTDSDHDDGYQIEDNYNVHQDSDEQNIVEKIKEIEEAEESEAESARWADAIATTQVIAFIVIAMVAVVVIYVLYIARKKSKERDVEKEYRNLLQEDYDSDDEKMLRKKRYG